MMGRDQETDRGMDQGEVTEGFYEVDEGGDSMCLMCGMHLGNHRLDCLVGECEDRLAEFVLQMEMEIDEATGLGKVGEK